MLAEISLAAGRLAVLAQAAGADPAASLPSAASRSLLDYIKAGGPLSVILILLSIIAVGLMITNLIVLRVSYLAPLTILAALERLLRDRNAEGVLQFARDKANDSFITRVMAGGISRASRSQFGLLELKPALEEAASRELEKLDRPTHGLALLAAVGPMLGLLGTVFGMIGAFGTISHEEGAAKSQKLAEFMSLALVNTAEGLMLAIPCTIAYSLFRRRTDRMMAEVADIAERLASLLQSAAQGARQAGPAPQARAIGHGPLPTAMGPGPAPMPVPQPSQPQPVGVGAVSPVAPPPVAAPPVAPLAGSPLPAAGRGPLFAPPAN